MSFSINGIPNIENIGTLGLYGGATDPDGWVICDGQPRTNTTGTYNNLFLQTTGKNYGYGPTWTNGTISINIPTSVTLKDIRGVAVSDVGTVVLADRGSTGLYISQNNGSTWSIISGSGLPSISFSCVDISQDGTKIIAAANDVGQGLFLSTNSGSTWSQLYTNNGLPTDLISMDNGSNKVAISNDGTKIAVAYTNGFTYFSSNSGATFQNVSPAGPTGTSMATQNVAKNYWGLGMSKDGTKLVTALNNGSLVPDINLLNWAQIKPTSGVPTGAGYWGVETSSSGQYMSLVVDGGSIYLSSNYGNNWFVPAGASIGKSYTNAALSGTGQYILVSAWGGTAAQLSTSYGQFWTTPGALSNVSASFGGMSSTGQYMLYTIYNGTTTGVYMSTNFGTNFKLNPGIPTGQTYMSARTSATGQYMAVSSLTNTYISANYGSTWTVNPTGVTKGYGISISGTGQYILIGANDTSVKLALSSNYGVSFSQTNASITNAAWNSVSVSYTGQYMAAGISNGTFHLSSSYGAFWTSNPGSGIAATGGRCGIAISSNAQYILASVGFNSVYLASNPYWAPGQNNVAKYWTKGPGGLTTGAFSTVNASFDGKYIIAAITSGAAYLSIDYGQSWTARPGSGLPATAAYYFSSISNTGQYIGLSGSNFLYLSSNFGNNWTTNPSGLGGAAQATICISGTGQYMILGYWNSSPQIGYLSTSYGQFWTAIPSVIYNFNNFLITISQSGQYMLIPCSASTLFLSSSYGQYWTNINTNATIGGWNGSVISGSGQYIILYGISGGSSFYFSSSYGKYWNNIPTYTSYGTNVITNLNSISQTGQYMILTTSTGPIYSSNYGVNWTSTIGLGLPTTAGTACSISSNGNYMLYTTGSNMYMSTYKDQPWLQQQNQVGQNFIANPGGLSNSGIDWRGSGVSASGQYILTISNTTCYVSSTYGNSFYSASISNRYNCSVSYSGQYMIAGKYNSGTPSLSSTYGQTWYTPVIFTNNGYCTRISGNGQYALVGTGSAGGTTGSLYLSTDSGKNWMTNPGIGLPASAIYVGVGVSSNGQYMFANNYISTNYGDNWSSPATMPSIGGAACGNMSGNGKVIILTIEGSNNVSISTNYGSSFINLSQATAYPDLGISHTGQYIINGNLLSKDYGKSWTTILAGQQGSSISMNGNYMLTCVYGGSQYLSVTPNVDGGIAYSTDSGNNWINGGQIAGPYYNSVAISGDGSTMLAGYQNDSPLVSVGTSNTFNYTEIPSVPGTNTTGLALSSTGQYGMVTQQNGSIYTTTSYGSNFTAGTVSGLPIVDIFFGAASVSASGSVMIAGAGGITYNTTTATNSGAISFSTGSGTTYASNYGTTYLTFISTGSTGQNWMNAATSSNGQYMLATSNSSGNGFLYLSTNSGAFWSAPLGTGVAYQLAWNGCAISPNTNSSGYYVMAATVTGQSVYISINSGATWTIPSTLPTAAWSSISIDTDGSIMAVIASGSQIYVSSNSGSTFLPYGSALAYTDIAVSLTGQYMAATVSSGQIYVSTSFGTTWTPYGPTADWLDIHMSGAANIMVAAVNNGPVYISTNTGEAWTTISASNNVLPSSANWANIGISSEGTYLVATISGGAIYTSTNGGAFWSNIQTVVTGSSAGASWSNCLAMSGNGSTIIAGQSNTSGGSGLLYVSINTLFTKTINTSTWQTNNIPASINVQSGTVTLVDVRGIATSDVGTMVMADRGSTGLYISQNNGLTWSVVSSASLPAISFSCVDISADGSDIIAAANVIGYGLYLSTNAGSAWTQLYTNNGLPTDLISMDNGSNKVAISNDGTKIAVAYTNGFTYFSSNSGATFQIVSPAGPTGTSVDTQNVAKNYWGLGMSKDGTKLVTAVNNGSLVPDLTKTSNVTNPGLGLPTSATYGQNAISYNGQYQVVTQSSATAGIWISTNYGNNWKITTGFGVTGGPFGGCIVSMSGSGQYIGLLNSSGYFTISSTYGAYWRVTTYNNIGKGQSAMSYTGQYIICANDGSTDYSTNYGNYFINQSGGRGGGCGISSTGQYMLFSTINGLTVSSDYGKNWKGPTSTGGGTNFGQAAMSGSGQYMLVLGWANTNVYVSSTYGAAFYIAFITNNSSMARQAAMSYTGQFMFFNGYYSSNYGVSWVSGIAGSHCSVNATGQYILSSGSNVQLATFPYWAPGQNNITKSWSLISGNGLPATAGYQYLQYSYTGQYVLVATNNAGPILSTNYGNNWLTTSSGISWPAGAAINVYQVGVSSNGQYMTAVNGRALLSTNYGFNWTQNPGGLSSNPTWQETAISGNGQYILFMTSATSVIWLSSTSGSYFYQLTNMPVRNLQQNGPYEQVCISNTGQYIFVPTGIWPYLSSSYGQYWTVNPGTLTGNPQMFGPAGMSLSGQYILVMQQGGAGNGNWWVSSSYGAYWKATSGTAASNSYGSGSVSASGQYMSVSGSTYFYFSTNYGITWTSKPGSVAQYAYVTISPNAQYMITAGSGTLYGSNFSGNGFSYWLSQNEVGKNFKENPGGLPSSDIQWRGSGVSASGQYILVISNTACYVSSTYGNSFYSASISYRYNCSVSYSGQYMIAGVYNSSKPSLSSTYGATWYTPAIFTNAGHYVRISGNGQYALVGVGSGGGSVGSLYLSTDSGNSWITNPGTGLPASASYGGVGVSSNGQYMFANNYISTNYGNNWTIPATLPGPPGCGNMSGNGKVIVLSDMISKISISTNYGSSFINITMQAYYPDLGISHTGQYIINGNLLSKDYGKSWTTILAGQQGSSISMNGNYMLTCVYGGSQYLSVTPNVDGGIAYSTDSGNNWSVGGQSAGPYYNSVAISGDGSTMLAGYQNDIPLVSVGTSNTFNYAEIPTVPSVPSTNTTGMALSSTGQTAIITQQNGSIFTSTSFGSNFTSATIAGTNGTTITDQFYGAASISQNGLVAGAAANGVVYTSTTANTSGQVAFSTGAGSTFNANNQNFSTQSGTSYSTFRSQSITTQAWSSVSISSNGQVMAATSSNSAGGYLFLSTNTGSYWSANTALSSSQLNLSSVALSTSGQFILVSVSSSNLYVSTNTGTTWTTISNAQPWTEVAVSSDGQAMVAVGTNIQPYVSTNYGKNWSSYGTALNYTSVSLSTTGQYMAAGTTGGQIYLSSNTGANWEVLTNSTTANWTGISMSSTGQFVVASSNLALYLSTNYGLAWTSLANYPGLQNSGSAWSSVSISSDGLFVMASTNTGYIYASINGGSTWTLASSVADQQRAWQMISISGDGSKAIAINNPGQVYTSTDGQAFTFTPITMPTLTSLDGSTLRYIAKY